ncbi:MAG: hypothetical protein DRJ42_10450, partial [Deltaproteobacteria bacterium]
MSCGRLGYDGMHDHVHVVTVFDDRQAGTDTIASASDLPDGTVGMSLREALTISGNTPGTDLVIFAPSALPATIAIDSALPPLGGAGTVVDGSGAVTIDCSGTTETAFTVTADSSVVRGLRFERCGGDAIEVAPGVTGVLIDDVTILDIGGRGIVASECTGLTIRSLHIERAGGDLVSVTDCTGVTVVDAFMVIGNKDALRGVHFARVTNGRIIDSIIDPGDARLVNLVDCEDILVARNILDRGDAGVVIYGPSNNISIIQNVIIRSVYDGVYIGDEATNTTLIHNTMLDCATAIVDHGADTVAANNLVST